MLSSFAVRSSLRLPGLVVTVFLVTPAFLSAQGTPILTLLQPQGSLEMEGEQQGALSSSDYVSPEGNYLDAWVYEGRQGQSVTFDLVSDEFDAFLFVVGPGLPETLLDDDSGGACHARVSLTILEDGAYHVVATSAGSRSTGVYTLRASGDPDPPLGYPCGGVDPAILEALPSEGRALQLGQSASGVLGSSDPVVGGDDRPVQVWELEGRAGEALVITMESDDFDAYLFVVGPGLSAALTDDDGAGDLNARVEVRFPQDGMYRVAASSAGGTAEGRYTLRVEEPMDPETLPTDGRVLEVGGTVQGVLTDGDPVVLDGRRGQAWALAGTAGQSVRLELASDDFDSFLYLVGPGIKEPLSDDDSAGGLDSRVDHTFSASGTYRVIVSAVSLGQTGEYTLIALPR